MTNQEAFDRAALHLLRQGRRSESDIGGDCLYRGPNGAKCAVGALIPDSEYRPCIERKSLRGVLCSDIAPPSLLKINADLLVRLQSVHDNWPVEDWRGALIDVAERFGIDDTVARDFVPVTEEV